MRKLALLLTIPTALLLIACGGSTPTASTTPPAKKFSGPTPTGLATIPGVTTNGSGTVPDSCTVVSADAANQVTGSTAMVKLTGTTQGGISECIYDDTGSGAGVSVIIEQIPGLATQAILQASIAQASHDNSGSEPVSGIGDQALKQVQSNGATVAFVKGNTVVIVGASGSSRTGDAIETDLETICKTIAGQI
jgi:hypothetical protein